MSIIEEFANTNIKQSEPIDKVRLVEQVTANLFNGILLTDSDLDNITIEEMLNDIDVDILVKKIERTVASRNLIVWSDLPENRNKCDEIQSRFTDVKFNRVFKYFLKARYYGYSLFEKVYNEDFSLSSLVFIPQKYVNFDKSTSEWYIQSNGIKEIIDTDKYILAINEWNVANKKGASLLTGLKSCFSDKTLFRTQLRGIAKKYGETIIVFAYDMSEHKDAVLEKVKQIRAAKAGTVIAIPAIDGVALKDSINILTLKDLDPDIYTKLEANEFTKLTQALLGGTLTIDNGGGTGSYSLGEIHQEAFEQVISECCSFICDSMQTLLDFDGTFFNYDSSQFYFKLEKEKDRDKEIEFEKNEALLDTQKIDNILKLQQLGIGLSKDYISSLLGIEAKEMHEADNSKEFENKDNKKKRLVGKVDQLKKKALKRGEAYLSDFQSGLAKSLKKWIDGDFINNKLSLDFGEFEDKYILTYLNGYIDSFDLDLASEYEMQQDPFNMPYDDAIKNFAERRPKLYGELEKIQSDCAEKVFYIKRSTELEATKKVYEKLKENLEQGKTLADFRADIKSISQKIGMSDGGWYSQLVYRQNMANSYAEGQYDEQVETAKDFPYWLYDGVEDDRQTEFCMELSGKVFRHDDPIWSFIYPPNHFNCRSSVISLNDDKLKEYGLNVEPLSKTSFRNSAKKQLGEFAKNPKDDLQRLINSGNIKENEIQILLSDIDFMSNKFIPELGDLSVLNHNSIKIPILKVKNSAFDMYCAKDTSKNAISLTEKNLLKVIKLTNNEFQIPKVIVLDFEKYNINNNSIAGYDKANDMIMFNSKFKLDKTIAKFLTKSKGYFANTDILSPYIHELAHKKYYDIVNMVSARDGINFTAAKQLVDGPILGHIDNKAKNDKNYTFLEKDISRYAKKCYMKNPDFPLSEVIAESYSGYYGNKNTELIKFICKKLKEVNKL